AHKVHGYGLAVMTNADRGAAVIQEVRRRVEREYGWDSVALPTPRGYDPPLELEEIELPADILDDYVGDYLLNDAITIAVALANGALTIGPAGQPPAPLVPTAM